MGLHEGERGRVVQAVVACHVLLDALQLLVHDDVLLLLVGVEDRPKLGCLVAVSDRFLAMMSALLLCMSARKAVRELSTEAGEGLVAETCFAASGPAGNRRRNRRPGGKPKSDASRCLQRWKGGPN
jgi:hypothetical protein